MKVVDICTLGDKLIEGQCAAQFKSKKIEKGVAFPTCISVNNVTCHFSPLSECEVALAEGDLVKMCVAAGALPNTRLAFEFRACTRLHPALLAQ